LKIKPFILLSLLSAPLAAAVPNRITYQGRLTKSGISSAGPHTFIACLTNGVSNLWCDSGQTLTLPISGDFTLILQPNIPIDWVNNAVKLQLKVDGQLLSPPDDFTSVPYSLVAATATSVDAQNVHLKNIVQDLSQWQSATNPGLIDPAKIDFSGTPSPGPGSGLVPQGAIIIWDQSPSCPAGYTRVAAFDGRFLEGATAPGGIGGSATHTHAMDHTHDLSNHTHTGTTNQGGVDHTHTGWTGSATGGAAGFSGGGWAGSWLSHNHSFTTDGASAYLHTHDFTTGPPSVNLTGPASTSTTGASSSIPPFYDVLFCRKQ